MAKFLKLDELIKLKKQPKTIHFTHEVREGGVIRESSDLAQDWDNIMLLSETPTSSELYQYLVWNNCENSYFFILFSKDRI